MRETAPGGSTWLNEVVDRFIREWKVGPRPVLEDYVRDVGPRRPELLLELVQLDVKYRQDDGEHPDAAEYIGRFPGDIEVITRAFAELTAPREQASTPPADVPQPDMPGRIGRYLIEEIIGTGGMGVVYRARDEKLKRKVAIKVLRDEALRGTNVDVLEREALRLANIEHPNIVNVFDVVIDERAPFAMVMKYVEGRSLKDLLKDQKNEAKWFEHTWVIEIVTQIAIALDHVHSDRGREDGKFGIVHCDLKPANILIDKSGKPHILDFGVAVDRNTQHAEPRVIAGTLRYMSPEQLRGDRNWLKPTSDIWSVGVILYELLTGELPFQSRDYRELLDEIERSPPRPLHQFHRARQIPPKLGEVCLRCLERSPHARYQTARHIVKALDDLGGSQRRRRRNFILLGGGVAFAVAIGLGGLALFQNGTKVRPMDNAASPDALFQLIPNDCPKFTVTPHDHLKCASQVGEAHNAPPFDSRRLYALLHVKNESSRMIKILRWFHTCYKPEVLQECEPQVDEWKPGEDKPFGVGGRVFPTYHWFRIKDLSSDRPPFDVDGKWHYLEAGGKPYHIFVTDELFDAKHSVGKGRGFRIERDTTLVGAASR